MATTLEQKVSVFEAQVSLGSWFLSNEQQIEEHTALLPYAHYLRQAWNELRLSGILCVDGKPVAYLCGGIRFSRQQKKEHQRFVWNQGLVPLLIFLTPDHVDVHSGVKSPDKDQTDSALDRDKLSSHVLDFVAETLELASFVRSIETGQIFQDYAALFPFSESVDRSLLRNLVVAARQLQNAEWSLPRAHALLGRALFVSFLHARKFIKPDYYPAGMESLLDILNRPTIKEVKHLLYKEFFPRLKREFNGTMFDMALNDEEQNIGTKQLDILKAFLGGDEMETSQMTLEFRAYDFRFIPVEIISAIYEEFMKGADAGKKREDGAYYTPRHLAETTLHVALERRYAEASQWKVLDPACGSGIFLVAMFNLLAEQWRRNNATRHRQTKAQALLDILQHQIKGVDINPEACRITAFSLYLALFEKLQPMDVEEFKEKVRQGPFLPPLLWNPIETIPQPVILQGDFLKDGLPLSRDFNLIIGNPPWESRGKRQIALNFVFRSGHFLQDAGVGCMLLPSSILVNRNGYLDGDWFKKVTVEKVVQLADFRHVLFEATHPCFILRYAQARPPHDHIIVYETPKLNRFDRRQGVIVVEPDDHKLVQQSEVLQASRDGRLQTLWNRRFWGTPRDEAFLRRLDTFPTLSDVITERKWQEGVGFQPYYPGISPTYQPLSPWKLSDAFLSNDRDFPQLVLSDNDFITLKEALQSTTHRQRKVKASLEYLRRKPDSHVFTPPMVVFSKGFTKAAFTDYAGKVRFFDGLRSISGPEEDSDLLRFLAVVFSSRLFKYITFHSGSNIGIERDQIHLYESLALPFPLPGQEFASPKADLIIRQVADILRNLKAGSGPFGKPEIPALLSEELENLVGAYYSVSSPERILIEDTLSISDQSIHRHSTDGDIPSLAFPHFLQRKLYADQLCATLNSLARKKGITISAVGMASPQLNLFLLTVVFGHEERAYTELDEVRLWPALERVNKAAKHENGRFSYLRGFSYFEGDRLHMLKPATMRNWSRSAALNDADAIFEHLVEQAS